MYIVKLLRNGESETVEFKARFNKETIVSLAAFANTKGGKVISEYPGVCLDEGVVTGWEGLIWDMRKKPAHIN